MNDLKDYKSRSKHRHKLSHSQKRVDRLRELGINLTFGKEIRTPKVKSKGLTVNPQGAAKAHMMRMMKEVRDVDKQVVMCQIENVKRTFIKDHSNEAKLSILENTLCIVEKNKQNFGKVKNMSSLEKNRIALNLLSSLKHKDQLYQQEKVKSLARNIKFQEFESHKRLSAAQPLYITTSPVKSHQSSLGMFTASQQNFQKNSGLQMLNQQNKQLGQYLNTISSSTTNQGYERSKQLQQQKFLMGLESNFLQSMNDNLEDSIEDKKAQARRKNISISILKQKQSRIGDPLNNFGIMALNNVIPYKKPILKQTTVFVNAKGVMHELEQNHGGLYFTKMGASKNEIQISPQHSKMPKTKSSFIQSTMKRINSAKPSKFRSIVLVQETESPVLTSRALSPSTNDATASFRHFYKHQGPVFSNSEVAQQLKKQLLL